ncbi:MAG: exodeoxyribonuclease VII large subunit [Candidatus Margulisbacteria bacterium]|nr:exodeoxyribonuclease VII large subunit [Candidatus Margulisiibacteriota bacterium]
MDPKSFTVSEANTHIKNLLESDLFFQDVWITGDISNLKVYQLGGQIYFNLSDGHSQINCVIYASFLKNIPFNIENGLSVTIRGKLKAYQKRGTYNIQVAYMTQKGEGDLSKLLEALKQKLFKEGLFDPEKKKPIPTYPAHVGVITALDSAAMWDFVTLSNESAPHVSITIIPAVMQGIKCPGSVSEALDIAKKVKKFDTVCIIRGGGSAEDLSGFNDEHLIRKISAFPIPVLSAIGHEVDYTLTDFAVDLRCPTPSSLAHQLFDPFLNIKPLIQELIQKMDDTLSDRFEDQRDYVSTLITNATTQIDHHVHSIKQNLKIVMNRLHEANPLQKLAKGYSICSFPDSQKPVKNIAQLKPGSEVKIQLTDGSFLSTVSRIDKELI